MADSQPLSALGQAAADYLRLRRHLGHKLDEAGRLLPRFVAYLDAIGAPTVTVATALAWATQPDVDPNSSVGPRRMTVARGFARHLSGIDARTEVPPAGLLACRQHRRTPYLFSTSEVTALMAQAAATIPSH